MQDAFLHQLRSKKSFLKAKLVKDVAVTYDTEMDSPETLQLSGQKYSPEEALALFLDLKLTKHHYMLLRVSALKKGFNIYPSYAEVLVAKKACYPKEIHITQKSAKINLQSLLDHTAKRLIMSFENDILQKMSNSSRVVLIGKWGCDGLSGQREYKQVLEEEVSHSNLFMTSFVPLRLRVFEENTFVDFWTNAIPSSSKYCRPSKFEFYKESSQFIQNEVSDITAKISNLSPMKFNRNNYCFDVTYELLLTMVVGKVCQAITKTKSTSTCIVCQQPISQLN